MRKLFLGLAFFLCLHQQYAKAETVDRILAVVNEQVITQGEVDRAMAAVYMQLSAKFSGKELEDKLEQVKRDILKQMIEEKLVLSQAKNYEIKVNEKDIDATIKEMRTKSGLTTDEEFSEMLAEQGLSMKMLRQLLIDQTIVRNIIQFEVASKIKPSPQEMLAYYEEHRSEFKLPERVHLYVITLYKDDQGEKVYKKAQLIVQLLKQGADFKKLARQRSQDNNASSGGDMGIIEKGHFLPEIDAAVFNLEKGKFTDVVETPTAFYIFKLAEKLPEEEMPFSLVQDKIEAILFEKQFEVKYREWIEKIKKNAQIIIK
jgi:peptidyl-prolyl cis-trans isomerase SurA